MLPDATRTPSPLRAQDGSSLVEVLVSTLLLALVVCAVYAMSDITFGLTSKDQERSHVMRDGQVGLHQMTRELRQSYNVVAWSATSIEADVFTDSGSERVSYDCNVAHPTITGRKRCVRTVGLTSRVVVDHVASAAFTYQLSGTVPTPRYADIVLRIKAAGTVKEGHPHEIELHDGVYMRNRDA